MDYFSRWLEARPLRHANATSVATFIYEEIICRYGPPKVIQSDHISKIKLAFSRFLFDSNAITIGGNFGSGI